MAGRKCEKAPHGAFSLLRQTFSNLEAVTQTRRHHHLVAVYCRGIRTKHLRYSALLSKLHHAFRVDVRALRQRVVRLQANLMVLRVIVVVRTRDVALHIGVRVRCAKRQCRRQCIACIHFIVVEANRRIGRHELEAALRPRTTHRQCANRVVRTDTERALRLARQEAFSNCATRVARLGVLRLQVSRCNLERTVRVLCAGAIRTVVGESAGFVRETIQAAEREARVVRALVLDRVVDAERLSDRLDAFCFRVRRT